MLVSIGWKATFTKSLIVLQGSLKSARTRVFDQPSRNESLVILLEPHPTVSLQELAASLIGNEIFVGWPHLTEGKVLSVMDEENVITADGIQIEKRLFNMKSKLVVEQ